MALNPGQYRLSEAEHQAIFERDIKPDIFANAKPSSQPAAVIFGGQPGAGKSAAVEAALAGLSARGGAVQIIGDDSRDFHPHYARLMQENDKTAAFYIDRDTGQWIEKAIAETKARRVNLVIEGTMRDGNKVAPPRWIACGRQAISIVRYLCLMTGSRHCPSRWRYT